LRPDLVIVNTDENRLTTAQELEALGLKILVTQTDSLDQVEITWTQLGEASGTQALADRERERISHARNRNRQRLRNAPRLSALIMVWRSPWMASGAGAYMESLLESCGIDNVLSNVKTKWIRVPSPPRLWRRTVRRFRNQLIRCPTSPMWFSSPPNHLPSRRLIAAISRICFQSSACR
jgi:ABC-type Fe3+-hydroxamate transport system substrate-binding protein